MARVRDLPQNFAVDLSDADYFYTVDVSQGPNGGRKVTLGDLKSILANLQTAYSNSLDGRITTDSTRQALKITEGFTVGGNLIEIFDDSGNPLFSVNTLGNVTLLGTVDGRDIAADGVQTDLNQTHRGLVTGNPHVVTQTDVGLSNVSNDAQIPLVQKGAANGVAELDGAGLVPVAQLPGGSGVVSVNGDVGPAVVLTSDEVAQGASNNYTDSIQGQSDITGNTEVTANSAHRINIVNPHRNPIIVSFTDRDLDYVQIDTTGAFARQAYIPWPGTNVVGTPTRITLDYQYRDNDVGFFCTVELRDSNTQAVIVNTALPQPPGGASVTLEGFDLGPLAANFSTGRGGIQLLGMRNQGGDFGQLHGIMIEF